MGGWGGGGGDGGMGGWGGGGGMGGWGDGGRRGDGGDGGEEGGHEKGRKCLKQWDQFITFLMILYFFFALFIVQTRSNVMKKTIVVLVCIKREA